MSALGAVTLASVRTQAQYRADMVNATFVTTAEWNTYINNSYKELCDILIAAYGNDYFVASAYSITTDGTNDHFVLPTDFYKLLGVDLAINSSGSQYLTLKPFNFSDRNRLSPYGAQSAYAYSNLRYRLNGTNIWFAPKPQSGQTIKLWYVPEPTALSADSDTFDGVAGWEEYVIVDAAIKAAQKEESDVSVLMAQKGAILQRIQSMSESRDAGMPATVSDTQSLGMEGSLNPYADPWGGA